MPHPSSSTITAASNPSSSRKPLGKGKRALQRLATVFKRKQKADFTFEKNFSDAEEEDHPRDRIERERRVSATWTQARQLNYSFSSFSPPEGQKEDDYVDFMRGKRQSRYISFDSIDIATMDLSSPDPPLKRRYSRRWSELVGGPGTHKHRS